MAAVGYLPVAVSVHAVVSWIFFDVTYVSLEGAFIALVDVLPPKWGQPGFPLRRQFQDREGKAHLSGTVYIRRLGSTSRADASEVDMLFRRAVRQSAEADLPVAVGWGKAPPSVSVIEVSPAAIDAWVKPSGSCC